MASGSQIHRGPIVLADLSGYTNYVGGVEFEHSVDIMADLLGVIAERLGVTLEIEKLEGDAILCIGTDATPPTEVLTAVEDAYLSFMRRRRTIAQATSCECDACRRIGEIDLKFLAHHGSYARHEVAGSEEIYGPDVILAHRLLKNSITEATGISAYALYTDALLAAPPGVAGADAMPRHTESYPDAGEAGGRVRDLRELWERARARERIRVEPGTEVLVFEAEVAVDRATAWSMMTEPARQLEWRLSIDRYDETNPRGARSVGTSAHCVHGKTVIAHEIVDWSPPDYYTFSERNPAGPYLYTFEATPSSQAENTTRITWRVRLAGGRAQRLLFPLVRRRIEPLLRENFESLVKHLGGAIAAEVPR